MSQLKETFVVLRVSCIVFLLRIGHHDFWNQLAWVQAREQQGKVLMVVAVRGVHLAAGALLIGILRFVRATI